MCHAENEKWEKRIIKRNRTTKLGEYWNACKEERLRVLEHI